MIAASRNYKVIPSDNPPDPSNPEPTGNTILVFGDSITKDFGTDDGTGNISEELGYVTQLGLLTGCNMIRFAQPGRTLQKITNTNPENSLENLFYSPNYDQERYEIIPQWDSSIRNVLFRIGINDVFGRDNGGSISTFKSMFKDIINSLYDKSYPKHIIKIVNIGRYRIDDNDTNKAVLSFNQIIEEVGFELGIQVVNQYNLDTRYGTDPVYAQDHTHPNNLGHKLSANLLYQDTQVDYYNPLSTNELSYTTIGLGSGALNLGDLTNQNIRIAPGTYSSISATLSNTRLKGIGDVYIVGNMTLNNAQSSKVSGLIFDGSSAGAISLNGKADNIELCNMIFKNIGNYLIGYNEPTVYDGNENSQSINWNIHHNLFENVNAIFSRQGGFKDGGILTNIMKNFKFLWNYIIDSPSVGSIAYIEGVNGYELAYNTINNINTYYPPGSPNGTHNGIFHMVGWGKCYSNRNTNHQGNLIRAWGFSFGNEVKDVEIYNNKVWNSWKYSAFEVQVTPDMQIWMNNNLDKVTYADYFIENNTAGLLCVSHDWHGQMLDAYAVGGGTIYYDKNLGFELYNPDTGHVITDMINYAGGSPSVVKGTNQYYNTQVEAVVDTINFKSLHSGLGAL